MPQSGSDCSGPVEGCYSSIPNCQVCNNFNTFRCFRQLYRFLHVCNFCGGAHARPICPVYKSSAKNNKDLEKYLSSPVNVSMLSLELKNPPDKNFTHYLLSGLKKGFDPGLESLPDATLVCNNLQSTLSEPVIIVSHLTKEVDSNFMIGPFDSPPFDVHRINHIGIATSKLSSLSISPHDYSILSINCLTPLSELSLCYHNVV